MSSFHLEFREFIAGFCLGHCINEGVAIMDHHLGPQPGVVREDMVTMHLFPEPSQLMCDPVLDLRSLYVGEEAQHPAVGLCHRVDLVVETPVDLPLREEQLCPLSFSIEYLRGVSH